MIFILNIVFLLFILTIANIEYKRQNFDKPDWAKAILLSLWFTICAIILLFRYYNQLIFTFTFPVVLVFSVTSLIWFLSHKIIRLYGTYPKGYIDSKKTNAKRFLVKFELSSMLVKYFEIMFQQATFLFLFFVVLGEIKMLERIWWFTLIIAFIHLGNLFFLDYKWALFYTILSIPMAIGFGYLLSSGLVLLTSSIHLTFYLVFNSSYWFQNKYTFKTEKLS